MLTCMLALPRFWRRRRAPARFHRPVRCISRQYRNRAQPDRAAPSARCESHAGERRPALCCRNVAADNRTFSRHGRGFTCRQTARTIGIPESIMKFFRVLTCIAVGLIVFSIDAVEPATSNTVSATRVLHLDGNPQQCAEIVRQITEGFRFSAVEAAVETNLGIRSQRVDSVLSMNVDPARNEITLSIDLTKSIGPQPQGMEDGQFNRPMPSHTPATPLFRATEAADAASAAPFKRSRRPRKSN